MKQLVLVVDDDPHLRNGMASLFKMQGADIAVAATVAEGLAKLELSPTHLVLDMNLPDGFGSTVLAHIRERALPIRVAVVSGSGNDELMAEVDALKPDVRFKKPPDWDALMKWVAES